MKENGETAMSQNEVVAIADILASVARPRHGNCAKAVLHQIPESETSLFSVEPGETLAAHAHSRSWDLFVGISGVGEIVCSGPQGIQQVAMGVRSFCAIPPGVSHEVRNLSDTERFSYVLVHAPWEGYDFVKTPIED